MRWLLANIICMLRFCVYTVLVCQYTRVMVVQAYRCRAAYRNLVCVQLTADEVSDDARDAIEAAERVDARRADRTHGRRRRALVHVCIHRYINDSNYTL